MGTAAKKKKLDCSAAEFFTVEEGLCVQMMHLGPFDEEPASVAKMDAYLKEHPGRIDYIHGSDVARNLAAKPERMAFLLPAMGKDQLFKTVIADGVLPRKTFSMGHAEDKRYYVEGRKIK